MVRKDQSLWVTSTIERRTRRRENHNQSWQTSNRALLSTCVCLNIRMENNKPFGHMQSADLVHDHYLVNIQIPSSHTFPALTSTSSPPPLLWHTLPPSHMQIPRPSLNTHLSYFPPSHHTLLPSSFLPHSPPRAEEEIRPKYDRWAGSGQGDNFGTAGRWRAANLAG